MKSNNRSLGNWAIRWFLLTSAFLLSSCSASSPVPSIPTMSSTIKSTNSQTFCLGRFLIDVPIGTHLYGSEYKYDFAQIEKPRAMNRENFEKELNDKEAKLRATKHEKDSNLLRQSITINPSTRILSYWKDETGEYEVQVAGYRWLDGVAFHLETIASVNKQAQAVARMQERLTGLRRREDTDIPSDPGYCFQGGFIENELWKNEEVNISFRLPQHPMQRCWCGSTHSLQPDATSHCSNG